MSFYRYHVFFCTNERAPGEQCCGQCNASEIRQYAKARIKQLGLSGPGKVRINSAGCLDCCERGVTIVVYPEAVWYGGVTLDDVDELFHEHVLNGRPVERLRIPE